MSVNVYVEPQGVMVLVLYSLSEMFEELWRRADGEEQRDRKRTKETITEERKQHPKGKKAQTRKKRANQADKKSQRSSIYVSITTRRTISDSTSIGSTISFSRTTCRIC